MKTRALALLAVVAVPVAASATRGPASPSRPVVLGLATGVTSTASATTLLRRRTRTAGCSVGELPDRRCSPGAYDRTRTKDVLCDESFRTGTVRSVSASLKRQVELEYGLEPKPYGDALEVDHIVSLELGGANDIANLYPEPAPGYHVKDRLENRLHALVCAGSMSLHTAQRRIAADWEHLYRDVFGKPPS